MEDQLTKMWEQQKLFRDSVKPRKGHFITACTAEELWREINKDPQRPGYIMEPEQRIITQKVGEYCTALIQEACELRDWTPWKPWSGQLGNKSSVRPWSFEHLREMRVEIADLWCFLQNAAAWLGMDQEMFVKYHLEKVEINFKRQREGY
jgi:hypothetical protein